MPLAEIEARFSRGAVDPAAIRQPDEAIARRRLGSTRSCVAALEPAAANIRAVAEAQLGRAASSSWSRDRPVRLREVPVRSAGIYAPGGAAPYPSTVLMGCIPAKVAGVERVVARHAAGRSSPSPT